MATRRQWHLSAISAIAGAALLAACGGGGNDKELNVSRVISFGDSYSDLGTYSPATSLVGGGAAPYFGGRFTTNTHTGYTATSNTNTATIWVEWVAARVGVPITPAEAGVFGQSRKCPAAPVPPSPPNALLAATCTAYGQGGSLVTDPNGIGKPLALTVPLVTQVANHLTVSNGAFSSSEIVFVWSNNHLLTNFEGYMLGLPRATAIANIQTAANELAALVKNQIVAKGATRVAVMLLPDIASMPAYNQLPATDTSLLAELATAFNTTITAGLAGVDVRYVDMQALFVDVRANPSKFGLTNITAAACDPAKIAAITGGQITSGSSLFCNATAGQPFNTMKTGASASTWLYADGVHPTTGGHKIIANYVITQIKDFGWVPSNL